jgi:phosphatidate cytidylyltransferase
LFGKLWFTLLIATTAVLGIIEFYRLVSHIKARPVIYLGVTWVLLLVFGPHCPYTATMPFLIISGTIISSIWLLFRSKEEQYFFNWICTIVGIIYIGWMLSYWVSLRNLEGGMEWVIWGLLTIIATDTGAFLIGKTWGKHHLMPSVSPNKTVEGAIGGLVTGIAISIILSMLLDLPLGYWQMVLLGTIVSIFTQLGDLVESMLKRSAGVKDTGKLLLGHGGVLDGADAIIFTGPVVYYCIIALQWFS